jgi:hypothetical protein
VYLLIYLSGRVINGVKDVGHMMSFNASHTTPGMLDDDTMWAADNGCFSQPNKYSDDGFLKWLSRMDGESCMFAVAPDVVGDAVATVERTMPMLPKIRDLGYKAALVAQDGCYHKYLPWKQFDVVFIGGTTDWKLSQAAADIISAGKDKGKWVHVGRVNSYKRLRVMDVLGADSVDGTCIAFAPDENLANVVRWLGRVNSQENLCFN